METAVEYDLTDKQYQAWQRLFDSPEDCQVLFGAAKGPGKTFLFCVWAYSWAKHLIDLFGITEDLKYPVPVGFIGRKQSVDFTKTTLETWKKVIPIENYRIKEHDKEIIIEERVKVFFGGLDDSEIVNKFNSAEFAFYGIDQAEETNRADVSTLGGSLRLKYNGIKPPYKCLYTANPAECWLKEDFILKKLPRHYFIGAKYSDNPHLPENYEQTLIDNFGYDPALLKAYKDGDWNALQADETLIKSEEIEALKNINFSFTETRQVIACDPSQGGDACVIDHIVNGEIMEQKILHEDNPLIITGHIMEMAHKTKCFDLAIDTIGVGYNISFGCENQGMRLIRINSSEQATNKVRFFNRRAEMWWYLLEKIMMKEIPYPEGENLRRQLSAVRRKIVDSNGKTQLEFKGDTKKRLGSSPDEADSFVYGNWALQFVEPVKKNIDRLDGYKLIRRERESQNVGILNF